MKTNDPGKTVKHSLLSLILLGVFTLLATGSLVLYMSFGIDVEKIHYGDGSYKETERHVYSHQIIQTLGPQDEMGRWNGWIEIQYSNLFTGSTIYKERVYMVHGRRNGICTRTYPEGKQEEEHYLNGMQVSGLKSAAQPDVHESAFELLRSRYPWYLFMLEAFQFDNPYVENYLDTLETLLNSYIFDITEFDSFFDQVLDTLSETPYDTIIISTNTLTGSIGIKRMMDDELRLAVIDHLRSGESSTFEVLGNSYPTYVREMDAMGISAGDLEVFCNDLDDSLAILGNLDPEDAFFVDSADTHFYVALTSFIETRKAQDLKSALPVHFDTDDLNLTMLKKSAILDAAVIDATSPEIAEIALTGLVLHLLEADYIRQVVYDVHMTDQGVPYLPYLGTGFESNNSATSVTLNGYVIDNGGADVTQRGIAWGEQHNPTMEDQTEPSGSGSGMFTVTLEGLTEGSTYYARSYATNSVGTAFGNLISFEAKSTVGIDEPEGARWNMELFPNPASSSVRIRFLSGVTGRPEVVLRDLSGRTMVHDVAVTGNGVTHELQIDLSGIPSGTYHCQLVLNGVPVAGRTLVISH